MLKILVRYRGHVVALGVAASLGAAAMAFTLFPDLVISAPTQVVAGNTVLGHVTGMEDPCTVSASNIVTGAVGCQFIGVSEPLYFAFPTSEPMAPGILIISASDSDESASVSVFIR